MCRLFQPVSVDSTSSRLGSPSGDERTDDKMFNEKKNPMAALELWYGGPHGTSRTLHVDLVLLLWSFFGPFWFNCLGLDGFQGLRPGAVGFRV